MSSFVAAMGERSATIQSSKGAERALAHEQVQRQAAEERADVAEAALHKERLENTERVAELSAQVRCCKR